MGFTPKMNGMYAYLSMWIDIDRMHRQQLPKDFKA